MAVEVEIIIVAIRRLPFEMCNCNLLLPGVPLLKAKVHASADDNLGGCPCRRCWLRQYPSTDFSPRKLFLRVLRTVLQRAE
jgi:hypothetical protein